MKILVLLAAILLSMSAAQAQSAIGGHLCYEGTELSFQKKTLGNRIEVNLGYDKIDEKTTITALYQIVKSIEGGLNWYYGIGGNIHLNNNNSTIGVAGNIGIEYNFSAPFQLSLDWRPRFTLIPYTDFDYGQNFGLGIRYRF
jgi:hypothetical protein